MITCPISIYNRNHTFDFPSLLKNNPSLLEAKFIITGAQGDLGQEFIKILKEYIPSNNIFGIHRRPLTEDEEKGIKYLQVDILDQERLLDEIKQLDLQGHNKIVLIHAMGKFKLEMDRDINNSAVDPDVLTSNYQSAQNIIDVFMKISFSSILFIAFSSIVEKYKFPYFYSYDEAKRRLKNFLISKSSESFESIVFNISTLNTAQERKLRPFAEDMQYWLNSEELVKYCFKYILEITNMNYAEVNIYIDRKDFNEKNFVSDHKNRWLRETGHKQ
jgi:hypothetical protein